MQAFCAEKDSVGSLANVNKLNYLLGQLESNVLATVVGLKSSNVNYDVLANLLNEHFGREPKETWNNSVCPQIHTETCFYAFCLTSLQVTCRRKHDQDQWTLAELCKSLRGEMHVFEAGKISSLLHQHSRPSYQQSTTLQTVQYIQWSTAIILKVNTSIFNALNIQWLMTECKLS
ncbi:Uncharacterized protein APZ42_025027 [Daphnia magna]|uniref:Uncharacterized protein n=1 Tax=Daphnia magna TaxID=35525 RepID=A0A164TJ20_9CRUS|nr:Uncharacterized protein APZ42_025027 [Daphnia magna]